MAGLIASVLLDLAYVAASPFLLVFLLVASRGFTRPKHRRGLLAKAGWGLKRREGSRPCIWVHSVSVGEVLTAVPLVEALRRRLPDWDLIVSVSTFTGFDVASKRLGGLRVFYAPLDLSLIVGRFFRRLRPAAVVLVELELWPNFLLGARRRGVPVLVANGRISERSSRRYAWGGALTRRLFNCPESFAAQNDAYRARFLAVGVEPRRLEVLGNLKHDREPAPSAQKGPETRLRLGWDPAATVVVVGGSTHPGEETALLRACESLAAREPRLRLVLVPRHVERLTGSELQSWGAKAPLARWSAERSRSGGALEEAGKPAVLVVDTVGDLEMFYAMADVVFVGGSLVPRGGHNLFEPARLARPIVFGPSTENFAEEAALLLDDRAALRVEGAGGLEDALAGLIASPEARLDLGRRALEVTRRVGGAVSRHVAWLERHLRLPPGLRAC